MHDEHFSTSVSQQKQKAKMLASAGTAKFDPSGTRCQENRMGVLASVQSRYTVFRLEYEREHELGVSRRGR